MDNVVLYGLIMVFEILGEGKIENVSIILFGYFFLIFEIKSVFIFELVFFLREWYI